MAHLQLVYREPGMGQYDPSSPELRFVHRLDRFSQPPRTSAGHIAPNSAINGDENSCVLTIGTSQRMEKECRRHQFILFGKAILAEDEHSSSDSNASFEPFYSHQNKKVSDFEAEIGNCEVFMESENVERIPHLSTFNSYEELYRRLSKPLALQRYRCGMLKHSEDEPFM